MPFHCSARPAAGRLIAALGLALALGAGAAALPSSAAAQGYGAIAFSPQTGQWGWSRNYRTRTAAAYVALANCRSAALRGCRIVVQVRGACASLATGPAGWGAGWGNTQSRANAEAMGNCRASSQGCTTQVRFCAG